MITRPARRRPAGHRAAGLPAIVLLAALTLSSCGLLGSGSATAPSTASVASDGPADSSSPTGSTAGTAVASTPTSSSSNASPTAAPSPTGSPTAAPSPTSAHAATPSGSAIASGDVKALLARAQAALAKVTSVHVTGSSTDAAAKVAFDVSVSGTSGTGSVTLPQGRFVLVRIGNTGYVKAPLAAWTTLLGKAAPAKVDGKFVKVDLASNADLSVPRIAFGSIFTLMSIPELAAGMLTARGPVVLGKPSTLHGIPVVALVDTSDQSTLYVERQAPGYPIAVVNVGSPNDGRFDFTEYGKAVSVTAPPAAQVVSKPGF